YVPHRHVYGEQWIKFMKDGVNATPLPTVNTTGYIDHAAFLGTINPDTNKIPKHLFQGYLNIYNNYFKAPNLQSFIASMTQKLTLSDISDESKNYLDKAGITTACLRIKSKWTAGGK